nr:hypothetical protein [Tanacetum cinerariifolium]
MNPQETQQVAARGKKWLPSTKRVKISSTNIRLKTTVPQKEKTFQVVNDIIKNSTCFKAFTISADVPEIFMQQFYTPSRRIIHDISPRVKGVDFKDVLDDDTALTILINLVYKGPLNMRTNMFVDHMHQPWRTLTAIINKENVNYPELIWEYFAYQIDHRKEKRSRSKEVEATRKVYATHARIVTKSVPKPAKKKSGGRSSKRVVIQDTPSTPKSKPATSKTKLKGAASLTLQEQDAVDIMQALKESNKTSRRQPGTGGSNEGTCSKPGVLDEYIIVSATSSEGTGIKSGVIDEEKYITKEKVILEWGDEQDSEFYGDDNDDVEKDDKDGDADDEGNDHVSYTQDADDEDDETESNEDEIYKYKIRVHKDEDVQNERC